MPSEEDIWYDCGSAYDAFIIEIALFARLPPNFLVSSCFVFLFFFLLISGKQIR